MSEITYDDKVDLQVATNIANINKVTASDMNEIKNVVNGNADEVGDITSLTTTDKTSVVNAVNELNTNKLETSAIVNEASTETDEVYSSDYLNDKLVSVGTTAPTDGERVWFKYSKNILDQSKLRQGAYHGRGDVQNRLFIDANYYLTPGTYTFFSNYDTSRYRVGVQASTNTYPNELGGNIYDSGWKTIQKFEFTISNYGYLGVSVSTSNGSDNLTPSDMSDYWFMICKGSYSQMIPYEPYVEPSINVDGEEWYNKSLAIKSKFYSSITTSSSGYANLNLKCNEVAVIGMKHDIIGSAAEVELYSNDQGYWYIRCSVGTVYGAHTITNLTVYYI